MSSFSTGGALNEVNTARAMGARMGSESGRRRRAAMCRAPGRDRSTPVSVLVEVHGLEQFIGAINEVHAAPVRRHGCIRRIRRAKFASTVRAAEQSSQILDSNL